MNKYSQFSLEDLDQIFGWISKNVTIMEIAKHLGRNPSSISRELKRNSTGSGKRSRELFTFRYLPCRAQIKADKRALKQ